MPSHPARYGGVVFNSLRHLFQTQARYADKKALSLSARMRAASGESGGEQKWWLSLL